MFDSHIHSAISFDSEMKAEDVIRSLKQQDGGGAFTEHYDLGYPEPDKFSFDPKTYFERYGQFRQEKVLLGIELGMVPGLKNVADSILINQPFDYVIGSIHVVENIDIYYPEFYKGRSKRETYNAYFGAMETCIREYDNFDALGHIDYIARYAPYSDPEIWNEPALRESVDRVLRALIETDRVLEFNTRRIKRKSDFDSILPIYRRYHALGGRFVTIGSDAHTTKGIGWKCEEAQLILASVGLAAVYFKNRKRIIL